jgi:hypothetical protein
MNQNPYESPIRAELVEPRKAGWFWFVLAFWAVWLAVVLACIVVPLLHPSPAIWALGIGVAIASLIVGAIVGLAQVVAWAISR